MGTLIRFGDGRELDASDDQVAYFVDTLGSAEVAAGSPAVDVTGEAVPFVALSPAQQRASEAQRLSADGKSNADIAAQLGVTERTVRTYLSA